MKSLEINFATQGDVEVIAACNRSMAMETEDKSLDAAVILNGVIRLVERPEYGFYVVARQGGELAATLMVTVEWSDWRDGLFWWIQSVYVLPDFRRQGIYRKMYEFVKGAASRNPDVCGFRLYVERDNVEAQKTYEALGMSQTHYAMYEEMLD